MSFSLLHLPTVQDIALLCTHTHTHTQTFGRVCLKAESRSQQNTWVVCPSFPALCFPVYQQYHSDVLWFWPALSLPTYCKEPLHIPSSDDGNETRLDRFIQQESEKRNAPSGCHSCACSCPLKNVAELSAQLQFYRISVPRQLSNE